MIAVLSWIVVAALLAMAVFYAVRLRALPARRWAAAAAIPLSQAAALLVFALMIVRDPVLPVIAPYALLVGLACLVADGFALAPLTLASQREVEEARAAAAAELLEASRAGLAAMEREVAEAQVVRREMAAALEGLAAELAEGAKAEEGAAVGESSARSAMDIAAPRLDRYCANEVADALLALKAERARAEGTAFSVEAVVPADLSIDDVDLCAMLSNLVDNALNGAREVAGGRFVSIRASVRGAMLVVTVENSFREQGRDGAPGSGRVRDGVPRSRLPYRRGVRDHGWGLDILAALAARYDGSVGSGARGNLWRASLVVRCR